MRLYLDWVDVRIVSLQVRSCDDMRWIQCILLTVSVFFCMIDIDNKFHNMLILVFGGVIIFSTYVEKEARIWEDHADCGGYVMNRLMTDLTLRDIRVGKR